MQGKGQHSCPPSSDQPLGKDLGGPVGALPLPAASSAPLPPFSESPRRPKRRHRPICTEQAASPPPPSSPSEATSVRLLPQWWPIPWPGQSCFGQQGGEGASTEKGPLGMEIPLVFSHGQQGLFKEYIQLKIDFSV